MGCRFGAGGWTRNGKKLKQECRIEAGSVGIHPDNVWSTQPIEEPGASDATGRVFDWIGWDRRAVRHGLSALGLRRSRAGAADEDDRRAERGISRTTRRRFTGSEGVVKRLPRHPG